MSGKKVCSNCGYHGEPKRVTKGNFFIELILWLCLLIPGIIYSIWRLSSRYDACPKCGAPNMVPEGSPIGMKLLRDMAAGAEGINRT